VNNILIVEDHEEARERLVSICKNCFRSVVIIECSTLEKADATLLNQCFDLALIDISLPDGSGLDFIERMSKLCPDTYMVVSTIYDDEKRVIKAIENGVEGYILKEQRSEEITEMLLGILRGEPPITPSVARKILQYIRKEPVMKPISLTDREAEVLTLVANGYSRSEISELLKITPNTASSYIKNVYKKLSITSRSEATIEAIKMGLIKLTD